jgi:hypothetical protein
MSLIFDEVPFAIAQATWEQFSSRHSVFCSRFLYRALIIPQKWSCSCNKLWRPIWLWNVEAHTFSRQSCELAALYPQGSLWYSFLLDSEWNSRPLCGWNRLGKLKKIYDPTRIELAFTTAPKPTMLPSSSRSILHSSFSTKILCSIRFSIARATSPAHRTFLDLFILIKFDEAPDYVKFSSFSLFLLSRSKYSLNTLRPV